METYRAVYDPTKTEDNGVFGISLVKEPAMRELFVKFSKEELLKPLKFVEVNKEKRMLMGVVLQPDFPVYRNIDGKEFYVTLDSDTIEAVAHDFVRLHRTGNSSLEHKEKINGVSVVESWIVTDFKSDKIASKGLTAKNGSWAVTMKVNDDDIWERYVKTGEVMGFSIEGIFGLEKLNFSNMNEKSLKESIADGFKEILAELKSVFTPIKYGSVKTSDGGELTFEGDTLEVGTAVKIGDAPAPDGDYTLEDGTTVSVASGEVKAITPVDNGQSMSASADASAILAEVKSLVSNFKTEISNLKEENEKKVLEMKAENEKLALELAEANKTKPVRHTDASTSVDDKRLGAKEKRLIELNNKIKFL